MPDDDPLKRKTADWEKLFTSPSYLRPVGHGDTSAMGREVQGWHLSQLDTSQRLEAYSKLVTAVLNRWSEIRLVCTEPYMTDPILSVARMAFSESHQTWKGDIDEALRGQLERLWIESPRPYDESLRFLALNFGEHFPISRAEYGFLFHQPGWSIVAARIVSGKGHSNDACAMIQDLYDRKVELSVDTISSFVDMGFPKTKTMKWLLLFHATKRSVEALRQEWEAELVAAGMTQEEIYKYEP